MSTEERPPESESGSEDAGAKSPDRPAEKAAPFTQDEVDKLVAAHQEAPPTHRISEEIATGPRPEILWEPIENQDLLRTLLGADYDRRNVPKSTPIVEGVRTRGIPPFDQDEIDRLVAGQSDGTERAKLDLDFGPLPEIEKEAITDPAILSALLGADYEAPNDDSDPDSADAAEEREPLGGGLALEDLGQIIDELTSLDANTVSEVESEAASEPVAEQIESTHVTPGGAAQNEIDTLIENLDTGEGTPKPAPDAALVHEKPIPEGGVAQADMDALIAATQSEPSTDDQAESDAPVEAEAPEAAGVAGQDDVDALIATTQSEPSTDDQAESDAAVEAETPEAAGQDDVDALIATTQSEPSANEKVEANAPAEAETPEADGVGAQDDIDALIASAQGESDSTAVAEATADTDPPGDMDAAIAEAEASVASPATESAAEAASDSLALSQDELDDLLAQHKEKRAQHIQQVVDKAAGSSQPTDGDAPAGDTQAGEPTPEKAGAIDQNAIDELLELEDTIETQDAEVSGTGAEEILDGADMEARIDGDAPGADESLGIEQDDIDQLIAETESEDTQIAAGETPIDDAVIEAEVGSENVAAGAEEIAVAEQALEQLGGDAGPAEAVPSEAPQEIPPESEAGETIAHVAPALPDAGPLAFARDAAESTIASAKRQPIRALSALAAGLLMFFAAFAYLSSNSLQKVDEISVFLDRGLRDLRRAMMLAEDMMEEGLYADALDTLDDALRRAGDDALVDDARLMRVDVMYRGLPDVLSADYADRLHATIDDFVHSARGHRGVSQALFWKGKLYEREKNPIAARAEYREILQNMGNAPNLDQVLFALAELELEMDRPREAAKRLQRLALEYPMSPFAADAKLRMGDAYALAGDTDNARIVYIQSAQNAADAATGAAAFARLGELAYETGDYDDAIRELEGRLETATSVEGNDRIYLLLGKAYRASGRHQDARAILNELIEFFPESDVSPLARMELANVLYDLGMRNEAIRLGTETVERYPRHAEVLRGAGDLFAHAGDAAAAGRALLAAHHAGGADPSLLLSAGRLLREAGKLAEAQEALVELTDRFPATSYALEGHVEWAKAEFAEGGITVAIARLEGLATTTDALPQRLLVLNGLGELYRKLGLRGKAADTYAQIAARTTEPEMLAQSAIALFDIGETDQGLAISDGVDVARLSDPTAYTLLNERGEALLRRHADEGLATLERAHTDYPDQRSLNGVQRYLQANLTTGRLARARSIVNELEVQAKAGGGEQSRAHLEAAAMAWGDHLYERRDYRAAAEAYATALDALLGPSSVQAAKSSTPTEDQQWMLYQRANALYHLSQYDDCIDIYERVVAARSEWAQEAQAKAASARLELRLRAQPTSPSREAG